MHDFETAGGILKPRTKLPQRKDKKVSAKT
jgi:hypothetical protein